MGRLGEALLQDMAREAAAHRYGEEFGSMLFPPRQPQPIGNPDLRGLDHDEQDMFMEFGPEVV